MNLCNFSLFCFLQLFKRKENTCSAPGSPPGAARSGQQSGPSSAVLFPRLPAGGDQTQQTHAETILGSIHSAFSASLSAVKAAAVNKMVHLKHVSRHGAEILLITATVWPLGAPGRSLQCIVG